jgi:hypothetical protein
MGLLDKALHGAEPPPPPPRVGRGGFLAKADAASRQSLAELPRFPWDDLSTLRGEIEGTTATMDGVFHVFERLSEALPFDAFALMLPRGDELGIAASVGPGAAPSYRLPLTLLSDLAAPCSPFSEPSLKELWKALGLPEGASLRGSAIESCSDPSRRGLFAYSLPGSRTPSADEARMLEELFHSNTSLPLPSLFPSSTATEAGEMLLSAISPDQNGVAMLFDLREVAARAHSFLPSIKEGAAESVVLSVAEIMVGARGKALLVGGDGLALVLSSASAIDPELALFQFRKSFSRSLAFLEGFEFPEGQAYALDPSEAGCANSLARFLAS